MKKLLFIFSICAGGLTASARDYDYDHVQAVDRYYGEDVVHYDHHHRVSYVDQCGNPIGGQTVHHDHHYVAPNNDYGHSYHPHNRVSFGFSSF